MTHTAKSTTLGVAETDALPNIYFQSRIDTNIQQHVDARLFFYSRWFSGTWSHVYGHNADIC